MTTVANSTGVFHSFGYNFDDPNGHIQTLSANTQEHMSSIPPFIEEWQAQDIANDDVGGYYQNPVQSITLLIKLNANAIYMSANTSSGVTNMSNVRTAAAALEASAFDFLNHTHRLSGVTPFTGENSSLPHLDMAMGVGRTAMYITNQTDGVINSAPIMGSFTSLMIEPQLIANNNTLTTYATNVQTSIVITAGTATSNMSGSLMTTINTHMTNLKTFMDYRRTSDVNYYTNVKNFVDLYNETKKLGGLGETGNYLINNLIGTEKAKARIA